MKRKANELALTDKPLFRYWQAFYMSFFSRRLYVDVGKRWRGVGAFYLLAMIAIVVLPFALRVTLNFNDYFEHQVIEPVSNLPVLMIRSGEVVFNKPMPYEIKNSKGEVVTIIDTTGKVTEFDGAYPYLTTLITKDTFSYRLPAPDVYFYRPAPEDKATVYEQPLADNMNETFNAKEWLDASGIKTLKWISNITIYPTLVMLFFVMYGAFFLVFGMVGQFVAQLFMKMRLSYAQACRLLVVASTPQILLLILLLTLGWTFTGIGAVLMALLALYFSFGVSALKNDSQTMVHH